MSKNKSKQPQSSGKTDRKGETPTAPAILDVSRRGFLGGAALGGISAAGLGFSMVGGRQAQAHGKPPKRGHGSRDRVLLKGGIVLTLDPDGQDYEKADVLIEGKKIVAIGPNLGAHARVVDCKGLIVMPGFVTTHHHQYETVQRAIIADGYIVFGSNPAQAEQQSTAFGYEAYGTIVQSVWTGGRIGPASAPLWDLGAPPQHPEDCYLSELVASLAQITQGITCATDTSQASHTPKHTDAMIKGLMDSGARAFYDYSGGTSRAAAGDVSSTGYEHPGAMGDETFGVGRLRKKYFSSDDQLVTLGLNAGPGFVTNLKTGVVESYTGWQLAKSFGCWINNHNVGGTGTVGEPANVAQLADPEIGPRLTLVHCVRWMDPIDNIPGTDVPNGNPPVKTPVVQVGANKTGYPNPAVSQAWQNAADYGVHVSIACPLEMQMRHGMPPIQMALNYGIMPSLSPDVDTNQSSDPFTLMRGAFNLQRGLANELAFHETDPGGLIAPQTLTTRQVLEMATRAGAVGSGLGNKVGILKVGYEADIIFLESRSIDIAPLNNAPGAVVTMMDTSHVKHVMIAGEFKYWDYELVGWNVEKLVRDIERSRDKMLERIRAVPFPDPGWLNSQNNPYRPNFLGSCCYIGQNTVAPHYNLRP